MRDSERFRLLHGPYRTTKFRYGQSAWCEVRGEVEIVGLHDAPIPWPVGKPRDGRAKSLVVTKGLLHAIRHESNQAVCEWWGVAPGTVSKWRGLLGVPATNDGTHRLRRAHGKERVDEFVAAVVDTTRDPARRAKIAAARRGKPRPPHVVALLRTMYKGKRLSTATRRKMSKTHKRRETRPPWLNPAWSAAEEAPAQAPRGDSR
jgi:hypothetical protein